MYPKLFGIEYLNMYGLCIGIGVLGCLWFLRFAGKRLNIPKKFIDFVEYNAIISIVMGLLSGMLFQSFYNYLDNPEAGFNFSKDNRIKFVGTVYDQELLKKIRENAYGYFHGHEVGGTNPSLLEALGSTKLNLLLDVGFNREVAEDAAIYWTKEDGNLAQLINDADLMEEKDFDKAEDLHDAMYVILENHGLKPQKAFQAIYKMILGQKQGPRAASFLLSLDKDFVVKRLRQEA